MGMPVKSSLVLGISVAAGLVLGSWLLATSAIQFKEYERVVAVRGLAEREVPADVAVWPIKFVAAADDLSKLYRDLEHSATTIKSFLQQAGFNEVEITAAAPIVADKLADRYNNQMAGVRYTGSQTITLYSSQVELLRQSQTAITELGKQGIALAGDEYGQAINYLFTGLNDLKPEMIQESTRNARVAAEQFAQDAQSTLGKLRSARQGQFTIEDRDSNTPYIKRIRVVSAVEFYLAD